MAAALASRRSGHYEIYVTAVVARDHTAHYLMKRIYRIIYFNNSFNFQWHFQLDWCIMNTGDMKFHSSYIIPPFGCFRQGAASSFYNEK